MITVKRLKEKLALHSDDTALALYVCIECLNPRYPSYMLTDQVWFNELGLGAEDNLCATCLILRLNRPLISKDFTNAPVNQLYILLLNWFYRWKKLNEEALTLNNLDETASITKFLEEL